MANPVPDSPLELPVTLYRYYTEGGALLYVGISNQFEHRDLMHWISRWRSAAVWCRTEEFPTRRLAERAEALAIRKEKPPHNVKRPYPPALLDHEYVKEMGGLVGRDVKWFQADGELLPLDYSPLEDK